MTIYPFDWYRPLLLPSKTQYGSLNRLYNKNDDTHEAYPFNTQPPRRDTPIMNTYKH